jgi:beta-glucosidase
MEMVSRLYNKHGAQLLKEGRISQADIDEAVRRILRIKFRVGLFEKPFADEKLEASVVMNAEHVTAAREAAARSLVLLKNDKNVLPLDKGARAIAVVGPLADSQLDVIGSWSGDGRPEDAVTLLAGVKAKVGSSAKVLYAKGCEVEGGTRDGIGEAVKAARAADVTIVAVGESAAMSGEAASRSSLDIPGHQLELVRAIHETGKPYAVVLMNGRPLTINWLAENSPAILETWFAGSQAGNAIADVLFGDVNPGGKLPITFPRNVGQVPIYYNAKNTGRPPTDQKYTSKYLDVPVTPLYPFGHGLSYTQFKISNLQLGAKSVGPDGPLRVSVDVENVGKRAGDEVVQLYIRDLAGSVTRPVKELKGFERISLKPGERRSVEFTLTREHLGFYGRDMKFIVEPGEFRVMVGSSSATTLDAPFTVGGQ